MNVTTVSFIVNLSEYMKVSMTVNVTVSLCMSSISKITTLLRVLRRAPVFTAHSVSNFSICPLWVPLMASVNSALSDLLFFAKCVVLRYYIVKEQTPLPFSAPPWVILKPFLNFNNSRSRSGIVETESYKFARIYLCGVRRPRKGPQIKSPRGRDKILRPLNGNKTSVSRARFSADVKILNEFRIGRTGVPRSTLLNFRFSISGVVGEGGGE